MNWKIAKTFGFIIVLGSFFGCEDPPSEETDRGVTKKEMLEHNRKSVRIEADQIKKYIKRRGYSMMETGSGLHIMIYDSADSDAPAPKELDTVIVDYEVSLINGRDIYASDSTHAKFVVGRDDVESGIQEGVQLMRVGDKAIMIVPSHLAHGYTGDFNKIPRSSTVIFDIHLLGIK